MIDDLTVLHQMDTTTSEDEVHLFAPKTSYRTKGSGGKSSKLKGPIYLTEW